MVKWQVSFPGRIKSADSKQQISLLNDIYKQIILLIDHQGMYFDKKEMDKVFEETVKQKIKE